MFKKLFIIAFAVTFAFVLSCTKSAEAVTSSSFNNINNYCTVVLSDDLMNKRSRQYASVKLCVKGVGNLQSRGTVDIVMTDEHGGHIWSGTKNGGLWGVTLKLGNDHPVYRIYVRRHEYPGGNAAPKNLDNGSRCKTWEISNANKCSIH